MKNNTISIPFCARQSGQSDLINPTTLPQISTTTTTKCTCERHKLPGLCKRSSPWPDQMAVFVINRALRLCVYNKLELLNKQKNQNGRHFSACGQIHLPPFLFSIFLC